MLIDSNIIIYAAKPEHQELRRFIARHAPAVIGLGDALIGATTLVHNLQLLTANTADFQWIPDLRLSSEFEDAAG